MSTDNELFKMNYSDFVARLRTVFDYPNSAVDASNRLLKLVTALWQNYLLIFGPWQQRLGGMTLCYGRLSLKGSARN